MGKEFLGYAYLNNEIKEIYAEDYPDYKIFRGGLYGVMLEHDDNGDWFYSYTNKFDLINFSISGLENCIKTNEQQIDVLKWKNISNNLSLDYFRKQLENNDVQEIF